MCGIVGLWDLNMASDAASQSVEAMSTKLRHRGPDGDGVWAAGDGGPALGHRRLSSTYPKRALNRWSRPMAGR
jgi:asparagine synthase (glutamine-hydrolysing)